MNDDRPTIIPGRQESHEAWTARRQIALLRGDRVYDAPLSLALSAEERDVLKVALLHFEDSKRRFDEREDDYWDRVRRNAEIAKRLHERVCAIR